MVVVDFLALLVASKASLQLASGGEDFARKKWVDSKR